MIGVDLAHDQQMFQCIAQESTPFGVARPGNITQQAAIGKIAGQVGLEQGQIAGRADAIAILPRLCGPCEMGNMQRNGKAEQRAFRGPLPIPDGAQLCPVAVECYV
jgi:hypothetical protein